MDDIINLYDFIKEKEFIHYQRTYSYTEGLRLLIQKPKLVHGISYYFTNHISLMNIEALKNDDNGQYYYEFTPARIGDIIDEIKYESSTNLDSKLTYYISEIEYLSEEFNEFLFISSPYNEFKIRITFMRKPVFHDKFKINSRYWLLDIEPRLLLQRTNKVITKYNIYNGGECKRLNN
jgi:hypothetical protein